MLVYLNYNVVRTRDEYRRLVNKILFHVMYIHHPTARPLYYTSGRCDNLSGIDENSLRNDDSVFATYSLKSA